MYLVLTSKIPPVGAIPMYPLLAVYIIMYPQSFFVGKFFHKGNERKSKINRPERPTLTQFGLKTLMYMSYSY